MSLLQFEKKIFPNDFIFFATFIKKPKKKYFKLITSKIINYKYV